MDPSAYAERTYGARARSPHEVGLLARYFAPRDHRIEGRGVPTQVVQVPVYRSCSEPREDGETRPLVAGEHGVLTLCR